MKLDASQEAVVASNEPVVVVRAGPGSGKTATLAAVAARLATQMERGSIHVLTFSRKAAEEIRLRTSDLAGLDVTTVHGLAYRIVCQRHRELGYRSKPSLYSEGERKMLAEEVVSSLPRGEPITATRLLAALHSLATGEVRRASIVGPLGYAVDMYEKLLRRDGAADYGLIMLDAIRDVVRAAMGGSWTCGALIVDEAQDIDRAQANLLASLSPARVIIMGDIDQCVYEWRGATPEWMEKMPGSHMALSHTYRCLDAIMRAAWRALGTQRDVRVAGPGGETSCVPESEWTKAVPAEGTVGVLCRTNWETELAVTELGLSGIEATRTVSGDKILEDPKVRRVIALALWPEMPDATWVSSLAFDAFGITELSRRRIALAHASQAITMFLAAKEAIPTIAEFYADPETSILERMTDALARASISERANDWISLHTAKFVRSTEPSERTAANLWWYLAGCDDRLPTEAPARVQVMTMHASKGLEFDAVVIRGMAKEEPTPEERRLIYVAITRARSKAVAVIPSQGPRPWYADALVVKE